jgi:hypothetical protein
VLTDPNPGLVLRGKHDRCRGDGEAAETSKQRPGYSDLQALGPCCAAKFPLFHFAHIEVPSKFSPGNNPEWSTKAFTCGPAVGRDCPPRSRDAGNLKSPKNLEIRSFRDATLDSHSHLSVVAQLLMPQSHHGQVSPESSPVLPVLVCCQPATRKQASRIQSLDVLDQPSTNGSRLVLHSASATTSTGTKDAGIDCGNAPCVGYRQASSPARERRYRWAAYRCSARGLVPVHATQCSSPHLPPSFSTGLLFSALLRLYAR